MPQLCILVLIGLPGSGKTTYAHMLQSQEERRADGHGDSLDFAGGPIIRKTADGNQQGSSQVFYHVIYDEIMPTDIEAELLYNSQGNLLNQESSRWKTYRKEIVKCVEKHIVSNFNEEGSLPDCSKPDTDTEPQMPDQSVWELFKQSLKMQSKGGVHAPALEDERNIVYIIDDNMYYRSMRYEYYQLARKYTAGFAQLYLDTSADTALERNSQRSSLVKSEVISTMANRMEPPCTSEPCNKHVLVIPTELPPDHYREKILQLIQDAISDPVPAVESEDEEEKLKSRVVCSTNLIHQSDQVLRKLVATTLNTAKSEGLDKAQMKELAKNTNAARQSILQEMKQGRILVEIGLNDDVDAGRREDNPLFNFIKTLLDQRLNTE